MKVIIISDIHDNLVNLEKCLFWANSNKIEALFCCGDVTNNETLRFLGDNYKKDIHLVAGNCRLFDDDMPDIYNQIKYYGRIARFELAGKYIGLCHEPWMRAKVIEIGKCDIIFYGHTHDPWEEDFMGVKTLNPGTLGGMFQNSTFTVWDMDKNEFELMRTESI